MLKIVIAYLLTSIIPPLGLIVMGFVYKSSDCGQCTILILVASFLMFVTLLVLNTVQFLALIPIKDKEAESVFLILFAFFTPISFLLFMLHNYYKIGETNTDFNISLPSIILNFILCFYTLKVSRAYKKANQINANDKEELEN